MKIGVLLIYILVMVAIIIVTGKKQKSSEQYLLGDRKIGPWMSAFSYGTSYFSAVIIVGYSGTIGWDVGLSAVLIGIANALVGSFFAWKFLARPAREMGERLKVNTLPSFFEKRYDSKFLKIASALIIFIFLIPYSASVYKGLGSVFEVIFGFNYTYLVILIAILSGLYLFFGGYKATTVSDFLQGIIMLIGMILIVFYVVKAAGGAKNGIELLGQDAIGGPNYNKILPSKNLRLLIWPNLLLTSLGVLGMPQMVHKFFAAKNKETINKAKTISTSFALIIAGGAYFIGGLSRVILNKISIENGETLFSLIKSGKLSKDLIIPLIISDSSIVAIPEFIQGLFVVLLLSASVSTLTALVLSSSSVITLDLIKPLLPKLSENITTLIMRALCFAFIIISLIIHFLLQNTLIVHLMALSWGVIGGSFLAPFIYGLLWKKTTKIAVNFVFFTSMLISLLGPLLLNNLALTPLFGSISMIWGLISLPIISLLTTPKYALSDELLLSAFGK